MLQIITTMVSITNNDFEQQVDDNRGVKRKFELIDFFINQIWILDFVGRKYRIIRIK